MLAHKITKLFMSLVAASSLTVSAIAMASDESYRFKMVNSDDAADSPVGRSVQLWADLIEEKSDGRMQVQVFHQGALGNVGEVFDHLLAGNVDMAISLPQTSYDNRVAIMSLPYLFLGWDEAYEAYGADGWMKEIVEPIFTDLGLKSFGVYPYGFAGIATRGDYAASLEEAQDKNLKVRAIPAFPVPQTLQAMGFHSVPLDWNEVYTSIQTGVVDGDAGNTIYWDYQYFGDLLDYYVHTRHLFSYSILMMNKGTWDQMDDEDREIVRSAANEVIRKQFTDAREEDEKWIAKAEKDGMEYFEPTDLQLEEWAAVVRDEIWTLAEKEFGKELVQKVMDHAQ
ncbi:MULTISPECIES: TRAP transporter substrate-binding protein DctP [Marinobacter]|uniref:TRAP transporter substrate-binding protein DctP n=1 Tax=Marinobacter TaxID=2742 RepID=UPI0019550D9D|nr:MULTISPECIES: TRAP transporter substrate-binding protein DctP [Marinobacter]